MRKRIASGWITILAAAVLLMSGCTAVEPSDMTTFLQDFVLQATAAFLF